MRVSKRVLRACFSGPREGAAGCGAASAAAALTAAATPGTLERPQPRTAAARPRRPSPGLAPQEGLDGQGDAAAAVLLLALGALPLHHDGGSWESYCRTQRWLLARGRRRRLLLLPPLPPALIPSFPEAELALSAPIPRLSPGPPPLPARGTWLREEARAGGAAGRGGGRSQELSTSPPPRALLAFSTSHCGQRPAPGGGAGEASPGQVQRQGDGSESPRSAWHAHASPPRGLSGTQIRLAAPYQCPLSCFPTSAAQRLSLSGEEELWRAAEQSLAVASFSPLAKRSEVHLGV
jgi:hypothetical protein